MDLQSPSTISGPEISNFWHSGNVTNISPTQKSSGWFCIINCYANKSNDSTEFTAVAS